MATRKKAKEPTQVCDTCESVKRAIGVPDPGTPGLASAVRAVIHGEHVRASREARAAGRTEGETDAQKRVRAVLAHFGTVDDTMTALLIAAAGPAGTFHVAPSWMGRVRHTPTVQTVSEWAETERARAEAR